MRKLLAISFVAVFTSNSFAYYQAEQGRWMSRDPIQENGGQNVYAYTVNSPIGYFDLLGREPIDSVVTKFLDANPWMDEIQREWTTDQFNRGCVGVTCVMLGSNVKHNKCYKLQSEATALQSQMEKDCECGPNSNPKIFSVHFWNNDRGMDDTNPSIPYGPTTGRVGMNNWNPKVSRPNPGEWHSSGAGATVYPFDYAFLLPDGNLLGADHNNTPSNPGSVIMHSKSEWKKSNTDFNEEVWCVQCDGGSFGK